VSREWLLGHPGRGKGISGGLAAGCRVPWGLRAGLVPAGLVLDSGLLLLVVAPPVPWSAVAVGRQPVGQRPRAWRARTLAAQTRHFAEQNFRVDR
jgi:hypothetical protein